MVELIHMLEQEEVEHQGTEAKLSGLGEPLKLGQDGRGEKTWNVQYNPIL